MKRWLNVFFALVMTVMCSMTTALAAFAAELPQVAVPVTISLVNGQYYPTEDYTVVLKADDADYPMPDGAAGGAYSFAITGEGTAHFPAITYERVGIYTYTVYQVAGTSEKCTYDDTVYALTVTISNKEDYSGLEATAVLYANSAGSKLTGAEFKNEYEDPENCSITVTKRNIDALNEELIAIGGGSFYVALFADEALTQRVGDVKELSFAENQATTEVIFDTLKRGTYYVAETDASGKVLSEGSEFNGGYFTPKYPDGNKVVMTENGTEAVFTFDNAFLSLPEHYYRTKLLTVTKKVATKGGADMKSDETFYAGIFADEDFTQLSDTVGKNIVPINMKGSSSMSVDVEVSVPHDGTPVTLYVTEVTANGTPVSELSSFAYTVKVSNPEVTLTIDSDTAKTVITNISKAEEETETEIESETSVTTESVKTGDESPILLYAAALMISAMVILILGGRRRKAGK